MLAGILGVSLMWLLNGEGDGLDAPLEEPDPMQADLHKLLAELREVRAEVDRAADRLALTEKRLRTALAARSAL
jgi:hypothetical protein